MNKVNNFIAAEKLAALAALQADRAKRRKNASNQIKSNCDPYDKSIERRKNGQYNDNILFDYMGFRFAALRCLSQFVWIRQYR